jgi:ubiquinone/menaquinone biosynthesis C-methylase UbiE
MLEIMTENQEPEKVAKLQLHRGRSRKDFFEYQLESARGSLEEIKKYSVPEGEEILDLGCGFGGNSVYFALGGFKVTAVENQSYDNEVLKNAIASAKKKGATVKFCLADAHHLPFKPNSFRVVRLDSVLEHLERPELAIMECRRVLKAGGYLFVNFPLYYSAFGGHTFDYIKVPWLHLLPTSWVCKILKCFKSKPGFITTSYIEKLYMSLNKMTLKRYNRMVRECGFDEVSFEQTLFLPHDAALFFNEIKRSVAYRSFKMGKKAFNYFSFASVIVFGFLYCIYRLPFRGYRPFNEVIASGIRSVLKG